MHIDIQRCTCMQVKTRRCTDTHSFFTHAVPQIYLHICIFAFVHICIFAFVHICIFADMQICIVVDRDAFAEEPDRGLPPPSGRAFPSSRDLWNCFSQTPPALLATKGARGLINTSFSSFFETVFSPNSLIRCVHLLRVLPSDLSSCLGF